MGAFWLLRPARHYGRLPRVKQSRVCQEADSITSFLFLQCALVYGLVAIGGWLGDVVYPGHQTRYYVSAVVLATSVMRWSHGLGHDAGHAPRRAWRLSLWVTVCLKLTRLPLLSTCYAKR